MKLNIGDFFKSLLTSKLRDEDVDDEEVEDLTDGFVEDALDKAFNPSKAQIVKRLERDHPDATSEEIENAITDAEDGHYDVDEYSLMTHEEWLRQDLQEKKSAGMEAVEVLAHRVEGICEVCGSDCFNVYSIEEAMEKDILPHDDCTCTADAAADRDPPCDCTYLPRQSMPD